MNLLNDFVAVLLMIFIVLRRLSSGQVKVWICALDSGSLLVKMFASWSERL